VLFADDPNDSDSTGVDNGGGGGGHGDSVLDLITLRIDLSVPETANCFSMDFRFLSDEFPEFVGASVNDAFVAELDASTFSIDAAQDVVAPNNFAFDEDDNVISVNTAGFAAENSAGTTYDGATGFLQASTPITPGAHSIYLSIFDQGDSIYDSAVFVDRLILRALPEGECVPGAVEDSPPDTIIDSPPHGTTADTTPTFDFHSTEDPATFECSIDTGTPSFGPCSGPGASHTPASPLADGTYTFRVRATDETGNTDPSPAEETFTVGSAPPPVICPGAEQTYIGTKGKDEITGTALNDLIIGLAGHDLLDGAAGNDCVKGNAGEDTVRGGGGDDFVRGGDGADIHQGGNGNDKLNSAKDGVRDVVNCGPGDDDRAWVDELDHVKEGCEKVTLVVE
jgi:Ca2+-binding RTX toxin-like protein